MILCEEMTQLQVNTVFVSFRVITSLELTKKQRKEKAGLEKKRIEIDCYSFKQLLKDSYLTFTFTLKVNIG